MLRQKSALGLVVIGLVLGLVPAAVFVTPLLVMPSPASAGACSQTTLDIYTASGFSCTIDGKTFSNWAYSATATGGAVAVPASSVAVIPCPGANPFCSNVPGGEEGFVFTAPWGVSSGQSQDSAFVYRVTSSNPIVDAQLAYAGFGQTGTGLVSVAETLSNGGSLFVSDPPGSPSSVTLTFAPTGSLDVVKDLQLTGGTLGTAADSLVVNGWSQVPEPASMALLGTGLVMIAGLPRLRQRRRRK